MIEIINWKLTKKFIKEQDFISKFLNDFENMSIKKNWGYKISDIVRIFKPSDGIFATSKWIYLFEAKIIEDEIFNFADFQPSQIKCGRTITNLNGWYFVLVGSKKLQRYSLFNYSRILQEMEKWNDKINIFNLA